MLNIDILQIVEIVVVFFVLYAVAQVGQALLNMITNAIDLVTVSIVAKGKMISAQMDAENEPTTTNVIGFQVDSSEDEPETEANSK